ncbi:MAG: hypothetical protein H8D97_00060 [Proteobacteria bacterium]|nr:hypothetical protein [Pseudomonadota bacterium]
MIKQIIVCDKCGFQETISKDQSYMERERGWYSGSRLNPGTYCARDIRSNDFLYDR